MTPAAATPTAPRPDERSNAGHPGGGHAFGVDIGGSGIKGAPVDLDTGLLATDRLKLPTPQPSTPEAVAETVAKIVEHFDWHGPIGATFPAVVTNGVARTAANVDHAWIGTDVSATLSAAAGVDVTVINDADAAGLAEVSFGAAAGHDGLVVITTLGTGIGTALIHGGVLIPNSELGHIELDGEDYETRASAAARDREGLSWEKWARRLQRYFSALEFYLRPNLFVVGGGVSRRAEKFLPLLTLATPIVTAKLQNEAGIAGAAYLSSELALTEPAPPSVPASP
jgi:polyphosphate glucokinase